MLFIVPEEDSEGLSQGLPPEDDGPAEAARPAGPPPEPTSERARAKVELDMDDAPFLEKEPEPEPEPEKLELPEPAAQPEKPAKLSLKDRLKAHKKKLILAGGAALVLIIAAVAVNMLFGGKETPPPEPVVEETKGAETVTVVVPSQPEPTGPTGPAYIVAWEAFWVELRGSEGEPRILICKISLPMDDPNLKNEVDAKTLVLRDAVYYYLKNRPLTLLNDEAVTAAFKGDVISIINEQLSIAKLSELYLEEYRIIGP